MHIHLIGVAGTAMATLAAMLQRRGHRVTGSDAGVYPPMSEFLRAERIEVFEGYDIVVHNECFTPADSVVSQQYLKNILAATHAGIPAMVIHCAMHCYRVDFDTYKEWFAFTGVDTRRHGKQQPITIKYTDKSHPITRGLPDWVTIKEELYDVLEVWPTVTPLATGDTEQQPENLLIWANAYGPKKTRVFSTTLGHNNETVGDDRYLDLLTRGVLWAAGKLDDSGKPLPGYGK